MKKLLQKFRLYPDTLDGKAVLISFLIINFAFLFHTLNFMWGNHDVKFIKEELLFSSGLFEGRFTQFIPYRLLTGGQILPLLNNLLGFAFLTAALWLLAKYWNIKIAFGQFWITVPFMERGYKIILALMSFCAVTGILLYTPNWRQRTVAAVLICGTVWATALTTFLVVPHTEFVSRIDFYGFAFLYAFFLGLLLTIPAKLSSSLTAAFAVVLLPLNILNDYTALKVWKQGFDAEMQILDNISERIENHPDFSPDGQYRFYQAGDISLRPNYYRGSYDKDDVFLLSLPYLAMWQGANLLEFYSPFDYIDRTLPLLPDDITPDVYDFFMNQARPWPHPNSVYVNSDIIIVVYNQAGLEDFRRRLQMLPKP